MAPKLENKNSVLYNIGSVLAICVLILPMVVSTIREYRMYNALHSNAKILQYFSERYSDAISIILDIVCVLLLILIGYIILKLLKKFDNNKIFVEIASSAKVPIFVVNKQKHLQWTNVDIIDFANGTPPEDILNIITNSDNAPDMFEKCLKSGETFAYESEIKISNEKLWLHITMSRLKVAFNDYMICYTISNISNLKEASEKISNQQRELQMQNDMLSLITAQMEVQQAGIKEQNEVLSEQHHQLEVQAQKLNEAFQELELRNKQITTKTSYITDSIKYAQTIQEAMLPDEEQLKNFFDNFIIYRPKDIVSGDFYWMSVNSEYTFVVLGDCTGHGVPGAFMSMIGIRILGELINEQKIDRPSIILETMHEMIQSALKQDVTENNDGMDIAICRFKHITDKNFDWELKYAGAKQPIFIKRKNSSEVEVSETDRRGVGGQSYAEIFFFTDHDFQLHNGDRVYLTSDGIKDQNNIMRKRFGTNRLKMLLSITNTEKIQQQKMFIDAIASNWQGLEEQRDDISLWGLELNDKHISN